MNTIQMPLNWRKPWQHIDACIMKLLTFASPTSVSCFGFAYVLFTNLFYGPSACCESRQAHVAKLQGRAEQPTNSPRTTCSNQRHRLVRPCIDLSCFQSHVVEIDNVERMRQIHVQIRSSDTRTVPYCTVPCTIPIPCVCVDGV
jgi:hypothetical protein